MLISEDDWRAVEETMFLLSVPCIRESILEGLKTPGEKTFDEAGW